MRKFWILVLLISLGLNLGLGVRLLRTGGAEEMPLPGRGGAGRGGPEWERRAGADSTVWRRFMDRRLEHLASRLDLRPEQVAAFRTAQMVREEALRGKRRELAAARSRVRLLLGAGDADRPAVRAAMVAIGRRQAEMDSLAAETFLQELEVLDPAQRERYLDFLPEDGHRGPGPGPGRGRRGGGPGGD